MSLLKSIVTLIGTPVRCLDELGTEDYEYKGKSNVKIEDLFKTENE